MLQKAARWGTYLFAGTIAFFITFMRPPPAFADRMHTTDDAGVTLPVGTGTFIGDSEDIDFRRIQPIILQPEFTVFATPNRFWLSHFEVYVIGSLEQTNITYKGEKKKDGLVRAELSTGMHWTLMGGVRAGLIDTNRLVINAFGHYGGTLGRVQTDPNVLTVRALGVKMDAMDLVETSEVDFDLSWNMLHTGLTIGSPIPLPSVTPSSQFIPFATAGFVWFNSRIDIELEESVEQQLRAFDAADQVPDQETKTVKHVTSSLGMRFDINDHHSIETTGSFFKNTETTVYWLSAGYSLNFGYPW